MGYIELGSFLKESRIYGEYTVINFWI
jgi:hypothetical protein